MALSPNEAAAVLSKSLSLIEKTRGRVEQIDEDAFPTLSSCYARDVLNRALLALAQPESLKAMNSEVLYNRLVQLQDLVDDVEASSSDRISWPLVSYCDTIWEKLFEKEKITPKLFYTVTTEHNYKIVSFSNKLSLRISSLLSSAEIREITRDEKIYSLHLASLEDANLPLYANIGHEFGHALYDAMEDSILRLLVDEFLTVFRSLFADVGTGDPDQVKRRRRRVTSVIIAFAKELFADLVGAMVGGPAFLLSLYEMGWGGTKSTWSIRLSVREQEIRAYPSDNFRLNCLKQSIGLDAFEKNAVEAFAFLATPVLKEMSTYV